jgi:D-sedoheptulose 7-phosphate isomerase
MNPEGREGMPSAEWVSGQIRDSIATKEALGRQCLDAIQEIAAKVVEALKAGKKVLVFGNGGSAADAQHIAAELVGRYAGERRALPAIALSTDTSVLTAIGNDYSFDEVFARQVAALGTPGDVALAISTSGNSPNVLRALETAKSMSMVTIGLTGLSGGKMEPLLDVSLFVPSDVTPRIQEAHILVGHIVSAAVEQAFLPGGR